MELPSARLTSQTGNLTRGVNVAIMNSAALITRPFSYFETLQPFRAAAASAFGPARYIAHADKPEGIGDLRCFLVREVLSAVRDAFFFIFNTATRRCASLMDAFAWRGH
jgi:hypothetical protein